MKEALANALAVLAAHRHAGAHDWCFGFDGMGRPQALGIFPGHPGRRPPTILLPADVAIDLARKYEERS